MKDETKEMIDYAVNKLDTFFSEVVVEGGELTTAFVEYAILEIHINFILSCIITVAGMCWILLTYLFNKWLVDKLGDGATILFIISVGSVTVGGIAMMVNGYHMYMASQYPLMWTISNKVV